MYDEYVGITPLTSLCTIADSSTCSYKHSCIHHDERVVYYWKSVRSEHK
jgi:hypothetical protein